MTPETLEWADVIFVMEKHHRAKLQRRFRRFLRDARIVCLDIPDRYEFMDEALVDRIGTAVSSQIQKSA